MGKAYDGLLRTFRQLARRNVVNATMGGGRGRRKLGRRARGLGLGFGRFATTPATPGHSRRRKGRRRRG